MAETRPYTETFIRINDAEIIRSWNVPLGWRAVVTSISCVQGGTTAGYVVAWAGQDPIAIVLLPVTYEAKVLNLRAVAYQGEQIAGFVSAVGMNISLSGYLFRDSSDSFGPPGGNWARSSEPTWPPVTAGQ